MDVKEKTDDNILPSQSFISTQLPSLRIDANGGRFDVGKIPNPTGSYKPRKSGKNLKLSGKSRANHVVVTQHDSFSKPSKVARKELKGSWLRVKKERVEGLKKGKSYNYGVEA